MKNFKVYALVSSKCKEQYIGMTSRKLSHRYSGHKEAFKYKEYKLYEKMASLNLTVEDFNIVLIKAFDNKQKALRYEKKMVLFVNEYLGALNHIHVEAGWNLGTTHEVTKETREKISKANKGQTSWIKGKKQSAKHIENRAKALRGKPLSNEHKEAIRAKLKGRKVVFNDVTCTHCGKIGKENVMYRWHFDNCKDK